MEPTILIVKPGTVRLVDMTALRKAGVIVVETDNPAEVKFIRAGCELSNTQLLGAAAKAIKSSGHALDQFGRAVCDLMQNIAP